MGDSSCSVIEVWRDDSRRGTPLAPGFTEECEMECYQKSYLISPCPVKKEGVPEDGGFFLPPASRQTAIGLCGHNLIE